MRENTASIRRHLSSRRRHRWCAVFVALATLSVARDTRAADPSPNEVEARFVFQLVNYVTWPESVLPQGAPLQIGVLGDDAFAANLREVVGDRRAQDRRVEVRSVADGAEPGLHLLFVNEPDTAKLRELARAHHGASVLLVAERFEFRHGDGRTRKRRRRFE